MPHHSENRLLPYSAQQIYDLVADVARYPEFLPWTAAARIRSRRPLPERGEGAEAMEADLVISFKVFREKFGSRVLLDEGEHLLTEGRIPAGILLEGTVPPEDGGAGPRAASTVPRNSASNVRAMPTPFSCIGKPS